MRIRTVKGKRVGIAMLAVGLAALLLFTACAPAPALTGKVVEIGGLWALTGAGGSASQIMVQGLEDYIRYFNEQQAIPGVEIKHVWRDTALQYSLLLSGYLTLAARGVPVVLITEETGMIGLRDRFVQDKVVAFNPGLPSEPSVYPYHDWCYFCAPTLPEQAAVAADYFMENWQEERPPRLAFMIIDSPWGYGLIESGTKYAQGLGFEVLPREVIPFVPLDTTTQLLRLRESGVDLVYVQALFPAMATILRDAERLELLDEMHFAVNAGGHGEALIRMAGVASEGVFTPLPDPWFDEIEVPGIKLMLDNQMKYRGQVIRETAYIYGWASTAIVCEAIKRAIENVGYDNMDGVALKEALDGFKDFDDYGLRTITYTSGDHRGATKLAIYDVRDGKIVRVSDWVEAPILVPEK